MDPNANLDQQLALAQDIINMVDGAGVGADGGIGLSDEQKERLIAHAEELAERVQALDHWLTGLGFLPERWAKGPDEKLKLATARAHGEGYRQGQETITGEILLVLGRRP